MSAPLYLTPAKRSEGLSLALGQLGTWPDYQRFHKSLGEV